MKDGNLVIGTELDTKSFENQIKEVEADLNQLEKRYEEIQNMKPYKGQEEDLKQLELEIEKTSNKLIDLKKRQDDLNRSELSKIPSALSTIGSSMNTIIGKVAKWGLALFGVRSMYNFIRQSASLLAGQNQQLQADIDYIRYAIASTLQPVIERIVQLIYKLLSLINSIAYSFFGVNLFANATSKAIGGATASAKQLKKQLAGFDEMNILQDQSSAGGGAGGGAVAPSIDLSKAIDTEQAEKIKNFWKKIIDFWEKDWVNFFTDVDGKWNLFVEGLGLTFKGFYDVFKGIIEIIIGVWDLLVALFKGDYEGLQKAWEKIWNGCKDIFKGILEIIIGLLFSAIGIVKGLVIEIANFVYNVFIKPTLEFVGMIVNGFVNSFTTIYNFVVSTFNKIANFVGNIIQKIFGFLSNLGGKAGDVIGGAFKTVVNGILTATETILNAPIKAINKLIDVINAVPGINLGKLSTFKLPRLAKGGIINNPGRGVYTGAIAGEAGKEFYMPLQDEQMLSMVGQAIGKYITINANITNTMNGRVISKELQKIQNESNFAYNR